MATRALAGATATYSTTTLTVGSHNITARYTGNAACDPSTSPVVVQTINPPPNQAPTISNATISPKPITANGSTQYAITLTATDPNGGNDIGAEYTIINYQGPNAGAGNYRGYLGWSTLGASPPPYSYPYWTSSISPKPCAPGGGQAAVNTSDGATWGHQYINLISCSTAVAGNIRTVTFIVTFNSNFTAPTNNNTLSGYVRDWGGLEDTPIMKPFDTFNLAPPATYTISGSVFTDISGNKIKDGSEIDYPSSPGITKSPAGGTVTNNANGTYSITGLSAGTYTVSYGSVPAGYNIVHPQTGPPPQFSVTVGPDAA